MKRHLETNLHYIVVDRQGVRPIYVFVGQDPELFGGPNGEPVTLELLTGHARFRGAGGRAASVPVLGQHPSGSMLFREFPSDADRERAHFLPVTNYRICDTWLDYYDPWSAMSADATMHGRDDDSV